MFETGGKAQKWMTYIATLVHFFTFWVLQTMKEYDLPITVKWLNLLLIFSAVIGMIYVKVNTIKNERGKKPFTFFYPIVILDIASIILYYWLIL